MDVVDDTEFYVDPVCEYATEEDDPISIESDQEEEFVISPEFVPDVINFQTPPDLCAFMTSLIPVRYRRQSLVIEPTPGAGNLLSALANAGFRRVEAPTGDFFQWSPSERPKVVIGNPPWTPPKLAYSIMNRCLAEFQPQFVVLLMPWLTLINSTRRTELLLDYGLKKVIHVSRSTFPGIRMQCCILVLDKGYGGEVQLGFY
jgi:hypothetical protein